MSDVCALVVGPPRSGTSAIAAALAELGVSMGDNLRPADQHNPRGYFEDLDFDEMFTDVAGHISQPRLAAWSMAERFPEEWIIITSDKAQRQRWGLKDPRLCLVLPELFDRLIELKQRVKVICTVRPFHHSVASLTNLFGGMTPQKAAETMGVYACARSQAIEWMLVERRDHFRAADLMHVRFEDLDDMDQIKQRITEFLSPSRPEPEKPQP